MLCFLFGQPASLHPFRSARSSVHNVNHTCLFHVSDVDFDLSLHTPRIQLHISVGTVAVE